MTGRNPHEFLTFSAGLMAARIKNATFPIATLGWFIVFVAIVNLFLSPSAKNVASEFYLGCEMKRLLPYLIALYTLVIRYTCRIRVHNDPRPTLTNAGTPHVFAALHAHQIAAMVSADRNTGAMVSRSEDGQMIVPALRANGHVPVRGSGGTSSKGGATALKALIEYVGVGTPVILAVDGPRGPRGTVHKGIGVLSKKTGAAVLPVIVTTSRRYVLSKTWDRMQIPLPFAKIQAYFAPPIHPEKGERLEAFAKRIEAELCRLEQEHDPAHAPPQTFNKVADETAGTPRRAA